MIEVGEPEESHEISWPAFWRLPTSLKLRLTMKTTTFKKQLLLQNVQMDGSVNFQTNGDLNIYPCPWESDKEVTNGERIHYRGGIEVDADGRTRVKRYNDGKYGPKQDTLFETPHGAVKITRPIYRKSGRQAGRRCISNEFVYVTFKFPKKYPLWMIMENLEREQKQIMSFFETRKEETIWK